MAATLGRKLLEKCVWDRTGASRRRDQKMVGFGRDKRALKLRGNDREVQVFDPSGSTDASMAPFVPLWSLHRRELEQGCLERREIKLEPPYGRFRPDYTSNIDGDLSGARRRARRRKEK